MPERDYGHRDILDKLNIRTGHRLAFIEAAGPIDSLLAQRARDRSGLTAEIADVIDVVLATVSDTTDVVSLLRAWKVRLAPTGGIWLLSAKRGQSGYVDQRLLIRAGLDAGLVDNKVCSVSDSIGAIRFVIRKRDR